MLRIGSDIVETSSLSQLDYIEGDIAWRREGSRRDRQETTRQLELGLRIEKNLIYATTPNTVSVQSLGVEELYLAQKIIERFHREQRQRESWIEFWDWFSWGHNTPKREEIT